MSRPRLTRRGERVVLLGVAIAMALLLMSLQNSWVQAYGIAGAAVLGLLAVALLAATLIIRLIDLVAGAIRATRRRREARRNLAAEFASLRAGFEAIARDVGAPLVEPVRTVVRIVNDIPPEALQRIQTAVADELAQRRRWRA